MASPHTSIWDRALEAATSPGVTRRLSLPPSHPEGEHNFPFEKSPHGQALAQAEHALFHHPTPAALEAYLAPSSPEADPHFSTFMRGLLRLRRLAAWHGERRGGVPSFTRALEEAAEKAPGGPSVFLGLTQAHEAAEALLRLLHAPACARLARHTWTELVATGPLAALAIHAHAAFSPRHGLGMSDMGEAERAFLERAVPFVAAEEGGGEVISDSALLRPALPGLKLADVEDVRLPSAAAALGHVEALFAERDGADTAEWDEAAFLRRACALFPSVLLADACPEPRAVVPWPRRLIAGARALVVRSPHAHLRACLLAEEFLAAAQAAHKAGRVAPETWEYIRARAVEGGLLLGTLRLVWHRSRSGADLEEVGLRQRERIACRSATLHDLASEAQRAAETGHALREEHDPATYEVGVAEARAEAKHGRLPPTNTMERYVWDMRHRLQAYAQGLRPADYLPVTFLGEGLRVRKRTTEPRDFLVVAPPPGRLVLKASPHLPEDRALRLVGYVDSEGQSVGLSRERPGEAEDIPAWVAHGAGDVPLSHYEHLSGVTRASLLVYARV